MPLIVALARSACRAASAAAHVVDLLDVAATMVDAIGGPPLPHGHGRSLLAGGVRCARRRGSTRSSPSIAPTSVPAWTGGRATQQRMVRSGEWKLIY